MVRITNSTAPSGQIRPAAPASGNRHWCVCVAQKAVMSRWPGRPAVSNWLGFPPALSPSSSADPRNK